MIGKTDNFINNIQDSKCIKIKERGSFKKFA